MTQFILGPIVGGVSAAGANIWGRTNGPGQLYAWLGHQADLSDAWLAGELPPLATADGFAGVAPISGLSSNSRYYYSLRLDNQPPDPSSGPYLAFTTLPQSGTPDAFSFAFGSCFRPEVVKNQKLSFIVRQPNFGLVRVDFSAPNHPRLRFEVHGEMGELLGEAGDGL